MDPSTVMKKQHLLFQCLSPPLMRYQLLDREQEVRHWRIILNAWRNLKVYLIPLPESKSHMRYKQDVKCASWRDQMKYRMHKQLISQETYETGLKGKWNILDILK